VFGFLHQLLQYVRDNLDLTFSLLIGAMLLATATSVVTKIIATPGILEPIPGSHKIAVIGLPGAGKTTLITALFELIQRGVYIENVRIHGVKTIEIVNRYVARLSSGEQLSPTKEKDIFVFRFSYIKRLRFLKRVYDVEIADFPGEFSKEISVKFDQEANADTRSTKKGKRRSTAAKGAAVEELEYTLFNKEFFSWIASSREYLFLIDIAAIYSGENARRAVAEITARIKTSWQVIEDATSERGIGSAKTRNVHIIFTKTDSLIPLYLGKHTLAELISSPSGKELNTHEDRETAAADLRTMIAAAAATTDLSTPRGVSDLILTAISAENDRNFSDLIQFFKRRSRRAQIIYTSMTIADENGTRLGVERVLRATLP